MTPFRNIMGNLKEITVSNNSIRNVGNMNTFPPTKLNLFSSICTINFFHNFHELLPLIDIECNSWKKKDFSKGGDQ